MPRSLLLSSIHDVGPAFESEVDALFDRLTARLGAARLAMLVVPDHWGHAPLSAAPRFSARLRQWADTGVEMFVHGWHHKDTSHHHRKDRFKARYMTAGEGEFLGIDAKRAAQLMADGKALIEDIIGAPAAGFIAPAWLYGPGAHEALSQSGFALAEDHWRVWRPARGETLARGPVITWATRTPMRKASSLAFAALARQCLGAMPIARLAVHPGDAHSPAVLKSIDATLSHLLTKRSAGAYRDLLTAPDPVERMTMPAPNPVQGWAK